MTVLSLCISTIYVAQHGHSNLMLSTGQINRKLVLPDDCTISISAHNISSDTSVISLPDCVDALNSANLCSLEDVAIAIVPVCC